MRQSLIPHPDSGPGAVASIEVEILRPGPRQLVLHYALRGDMGAIRLPPPRPPERADDLWQHTCFEAFLANPPGYLELNFSPSTRWAAYRFDAQRSGMREAAIMPPKMDSLIGRERYDLSVEVALPVLGRMGLSAVIEEKDGSRTYWALAHGPGEPDFHHGACFALELPGAG